MYTPQSCLSLCLQPVSSGPSGSGGGVLGSIAAALMWLVSLVVTLFKSLGSLLPAPAAPPGDGSGQGPPPQREPREGRWGGMSCDSLRVCCAHARVCVCILYMYMYRYDHVNPVHLHLCIVPGLSDSTGLLAVISDTSNRMMVRMTRTVTREGRRTMETQHSSSSLNTLAITVF